MHQSLTPVDGDSRASSTIDLRPDTKLEGELLDYDDHNPNSSAPPAPVAYQPPKKDQLTEKEKQMIKDMEEKLYEQQTWSEFTQNTTMHGVKYIFEKDQFPLRRYAWIIMVIGAIAFFVSQVTIRTQDYYRYDSSIDVKLEFNETMPFPAVTFCNQNAFRMTKAVDAGLYYFIDEVYSAENISDIDLSRYDLTMDGDEFLLTTAHQLEDLIDRCTWMGQTCNISRDFKTTVTEFGVCYTFNFDVNNIKEVDETASALSLLLNIEQYEHMRGPQYDAGMKMLLHDQNDIPVMKELGFAVAPGTHTLASVSMTKRIDMIPPWGKCNETAVPISECRMSKKSSHIAKTCGCQHQAMLNVTEAQGLPSCTVYDRYNCVVKMDKKKLKGNDCVIPCKRNTFAVDLSYAQISRTNIDRLVLADPKKRENVLQKFRNAKETYQRVDIRTIETDNNSLSKMIEKADTLRDALNTSAEFLGPDSQFTAEIVQSKEMLEYDEMLVWSQKNALTEKAYMKKNYIDDLVYDCFLKKFISMLTEPMAPGMDMQTFMTDCMRIYKPPILLPKEMPSMPADDEALMEECRKSREEQMKPKREPEPEPKEEGPPSNTSYHEPSMVDICYATIDEAIAETQSSYIYSVPSLNFLKNMSTLYDFTIKDIFADTGKQYLTLPKHQLCLGHLDKFDSNYMNMLNTISSTMHTFIQTQDLDVMANATDEFFSIEKNYDLANFTLQLDELKFYCWWMHETIESTDSKKKTEESFKYIEAHDHLKHIRSSFTSVQLNAINIGNYLVQIVEHMEANIYPVLESARLYRQKTITKLEMSEAFADLELTKALEDLMSMNGELKGYVKSYKNLLQAAKLEMVQFAEDMFELTIPVMNTPNILQYSMIKMANESNDPNLKEMLANLDTDRKGLFIKIMCYIVENFFIAPVDNVQIVINPLVSAVTKDIGRRQALAQAYIAENEMSTDFLLSNFMHVDIFYNDLSYETIQQIEAFSINSLFSEVGGFLGLLVGASILTICEIIDYFLLLGMKIYHKAKNKKAGVQPAWDK